MDRRSLFGDEFFELEYLPTPEEIAEACRMIQAGWTDAERYSRLRGRDMMFGDAELAAGKAAFRRATLARENAMQKIQPALDADNPTA